MDGLRHHEAAILKVMQDHNKKKTPQVPQEETKKSAYKVLSHLILA